MLCAVSIGQLGKFIPTAGGLYTFAAHGLGPITGFFVGWLYVGFSLFLPPFLFILNGWFIDTTLKTQGWWTGSPGWWLWGGLTALAVFCLTYFDIRLSAKAGIILGLIEIVAFAGLSLYMVAVVPAAGSLIRTLRDPWVHLVAVLLVPLLLAAAALRSIWRPKPTEDAPA